MNAIKFWMVVGSGPPSFKHASEQSARDEAERLCRQHPGQPFYVMEAMQVCVRSDVLWSHCFQEMDEDIPF